jgi:hypothetical protein
MRSEVLLKQTRRRKMEFNQCKTVSEAINFALARTLSVKIQPGWRSFDTNREREGVFVHLLSDEGNVIEEVYVLINH